MVLRCFQYAVSTATLIGSCVFVYSLAAHAQNTPAGQGDQQTTPPWAYTVNPPPSGPPEQMDKTTLRHVPGSTLALTEPQFRDLSSVPDWHPEDHPPMPEIVAHGRKPAAQACGYCHLPNGQGRPENSSLAGLPVAYFTQQISDYKNGLRKTSEPRMGPPNGMARMAANLTDEEVKAAAEYFAGLKFKPWIRVVETDTVPKTVVSRSMLTVVEGGGKESIGQRIIETPENLELVEMRDSNASFVAYVPIGSIKNGEVLVRTGGGGKTVQCTLCHGTDLKGTGKVPSLAGRSPSYLVRQMYDMQHGNRKGPAAQVMKKAVAGLALEDMLAIAAYTSSLTP